MSCFQSHATFPTKTTALSGAKLVLMSCIRRSCNNKTSVVVMCCQRQFWVWVARCGRRNKQECVRGESEYHCNDAEPERYRECQGSCWDDTEGELAHFAFVNFHCSSFLFITAVGSFFTLPLIFPLLCLVHTADKTRLSYLVLSASAVWTEFETIRDCRQNCSVANILRTTENCRRLSPT